MPDYHGMVCIKAIWILAYLFLKNNLDDRENRLKYLDNQGVSKQISKSLFNHAFVILCSFELKTIEQIAY